MKFKCRLLYGVLKMTFLPGWNWTIDCVRFGGDWANSIFYLILLYFNHIARNVRIVQNEKLHKLIFHYESVCTELWKGPHSHWFAAVINYSSALTGWSWCARSFLHAEPEGHFSISHCLELAMLFLVLWGNLNLEASRWNTPHHGSGLLTHQAIVAEQYCLWTEFYFEILIFLAHLPFLSVFFPLKR